MVCNSAMGISFTMEFNYLNMVYLYAFVSLSVDGSQDLGFGSRVMSFDQGCR